MGLVYRARQRRPDRTVAIKVIAPELAADPDFRARFEQESKSAAEIEHPNVIPVYDVGEDDQLLYIAMRFVHGMDLGQLLRRSGPIEAGRVAGVVEQVADALDAAHAAGLVHRDVKPGNILLAGGDHVYLTDFGLTKRLSESRHVTRTGMLVGTVDYIAPEQALNRAIDARADIYALGCVTYHMLAGRVPFPRDSEIAKIYAHLNDSAAVLTGVPPPLAAAVARAMAKVPADRFHSAGDFSRAVTAGVSGQTDSSTERTVARGKAAIIASQTPVPEHLASPQAGQELPELDDAHAPTEVVAIAPPITRTVSVGSVIDGRYRIDAEAGRGGMAVVYRATHLKLLKTVALKLMSQNLAADPEFQRRFETEARATSEVDHEHVIPVYDFGEDEHGLYIVMRYVEGPNLRDLMHDRGAFEPTRAVQVIEQVAAALDAAHARGLLHRDIKPANVLVEESTSRIFLADFGLVRPASVRGESESESTAMGTEWYMAPERRNHEETKLGDVYSLGCVLWEMLAGPGTPVPARDSPPDASQVPPALTEVVLIAVSERPHERFHSAGGLARAARAALAPSAPGVPPGRDSQPFHEPLSAELSARVSQLCRATASSVRDPQARRELERVANRLMEPLSLAVAGSAGSGKSTLINALLGHWVLPTGEPNGSSSPHVVPPRRTADRARVGERRTPSAGIHCRRATSKRDRRAARTARSSRGMAARPGAALADDRRGARSRLDRIRRRPRGPAHGHDRRRRSAVRDLG